MDKRFELSHIRSVKRPNHSTKISGDRSPVRSATIWVAGGVCRWVLAPLFRGIGLTWRCDIRGMEHLDGMCQGDGAIVTAWHGDLLSALYATRDKGLVGLVSPVWEGELIGQFMRGLGFRLVRGSSGTSPVAGLKGALRELKQGRVLATILDGPEGPARIAKEGSIYLASISGKPIVPMVTAAHPVIRASSWDSHKIPPPGARLVVRVGEPLLIPKELPKKEIARWTEELTQRLMQLDRDAEKALHSPRSLA